jgi:hypothetical protein
MLFSGTVFVTLSLIKMCTNLYYRSRDSSVSVPTGYWLDGQGSIPSKGKIVSLLHNIQAGSGAQPASYPMGTGGDFLGTKLLGLQADPFLPSSAEIKNGGAIPPLTRMSSWHSA